MPFDPTDPVLAAETLLTNRAALIRLDAFLEAHATGARRLPIEAREKAAKTEEGHLCLSASKRDPLSIAPRPTVSPGVEP